MNDSRRYIPYLFTFVAGAMVGYLLTYYSYGLNVHSPQGPKKSSNNSVDLNKRKDDDPLNRRDNSQEDDVFNPSDPVETAERMLQGMVKNFNKIAGEDEASISGSIFGSDLSLSMAGAGVSVTSREDSSYYYIDAKIPGVDKNSLKIDVKDGMISLSASAKSESRTSKNTNSISYSSVQQSFPIPDGADAMNMEVISDKIDEGLVVIRFPKVGSFKGGKKI